MLESQLPTYARHHAYAPRNIAGDTCVAWVTRGANFVVLVSRVKAGDTLVRDNPDEYVLLVPEVDGLAVSVSCGTASLQAGPDSLTIIPPGPSTLTAQGTGLIVRIFSSDNQDLLALADNHAKYSTPNPAIAPLVEWPEPVGGYKLRHYKLADYASEGSQMRVFSSRKLMINPLMKRTVPRDVTKLSPHSHDDFEQGSLALAGTYVHHLRYPWGPDMTQWREDEAQVMGSPSLLIVPPKVIHTSRNTEAPGVLVDIFAPPRMDFAKKGMVCNGAEYPMLAL